MMAQAKRRMKPRLVVPGPVQIDAPLEPLEPLTDAELPRFMRPAPVEGADVPAEAINVATKVLIATEEAQTAPAATNRKVRLLRGGVTSEHGQHEEGAIIETEFAALFITRGWAQPA